MKLSRSALFEAGKIHCKYLETKRCGTIVSHDAVAVFVTGSTVEACRNIEASFGLPESEIRRQKFNLGDVVFAWSSREGKQVGSIVQNGGDASLFLNIKTSKGVHLLPFTGKSMMSARNFLLDRKNSVSRLNINELRALASIEDIFSVILSCQDQDRFPYDLKGMALISLIERDFGVVQSDIDYHDLGMVFTKNTLYKQITDINPDVPDVPDDFTRQNLHEGLLKSIGLNDNLSSVSLTDKNPLEVIRALETAISRVVSIPMSEISCSSVSLDQASLISEKASDSLNSGTWVDNFKSLFSESCKGFDLKIFSTEDRDLVLCIPEKTSPQETQGLCLSWPKLMRSVIHHKNDVYHVNLSSMDVPSQKEISDLRLSLKSALQESNPALDDYI